MGTKPSAGFALAALLLALPAAAQDVKTKEVSRTTTTTVTYDVGVMMNLADGERVPALQKAYSVEIVTQADGKRVQCANFTTNSPMVRVVFSMALPAVEPRFIGLFHAVPACQGSVVAQSVNASCPSCPVTDNSLVAVGQLSP